jgi:regulator of protease activity HflC (stomatin/prohibitin superfamily)
MKRIITSVAALGAALSLSACIGQTVDPGNVGVKIKRIGSGAGVQAEPLPARWHALGWGEDIVQYPIIQRTYPFAREKSADGSTDNEELVFSDNTGLPMTADVALTMQVDPAAAPKLYTKYRLTFDQLLLGPIRNDLRSAIAAETEKVGVADLYSGGRQAVIHRALATIQPKWAAEGVHISQLEWIGSIRYPEAILQQMQEKTRLEQEAIAAKALAAKAEALAAAKVAEAKGDAESTRIRGEALRSNPQVLQQQAIMKWNGVLPTVTSGGAVPFVNVKP